MTCLSLLLLLHVSGVAVRDPGTGKKHLNAIFAQESDDDAHKQFQGFMTNIFGEQLTEDHKEDYVAPLLNFADKLDEFIKSAGEDSDIYEWTPWLSFCYGVMFFLFCCVVSYITTPVRLRDQFLQVARVRDEAMMQVDRYAREHGLDDDDIKRAFKPKPIDMENSSIIAMNDVINQLTIDKTMLDSDSTGLSLATVSESGEVVGELIPYIGLMRRTDAAAKAMNAKKGQDAVPIDAPEEADTSTGECKNHINGVPQCVHVDTDTNMVEIVHNDDGSKEEKKLEGGKLTEKRNEGPGETAGEAVLNSLAHAGRLAKKNFERVKEEL